MHPDRKIIGRCHRRAEHKRDGSVPNVGILYTAHGAIAATAAAIDIAVDTRRTVHFLR